MEHVDADAAGRRRLETVEAFNEAFNRHDVPAIMALMTPDCLFDSTRPVPGGELIQGQEAVGARIEWSLFAPSKA